jgi:outer membrane protein assembly factor BamA
VTRSARIGLAALLALAGRAAGAQETAVDWRPWAGQTIAYVDFPGTPDRGHEAEDLSALVTSAQGATIDPSVVRDDVATLMRTGSFVAVQVELEEAWEVDERGELVPGGVHVSFRVTPAPRVGRVQLRGEPFGEREGVLAAARIAPGTPFFRGMDEARVERDVTAALRAAGWPQAIASLTIDGPPDAMRARIDITAGAPVRAGDLTLQAPDGLPERRLRAAARAAGFRRGRPVGTQALTEAAERVESLLRDPQRGLIGALPFWTEAVVNPGVALRGGRLDGTLAIAAGKRIDLRTEGLGLRGRSVAIELLGLDARTRFPRSFERIGEERVLTHLHERGFLDARARVVLAATSDAARTLTVRADRGRRYRLGRVTFEGATAATAAELRAALAQGDTTLRRGWYSADALERGLRALADLYNGRGYPDAEVRVVAPAAPMGGAATVLSSRRADPILRIEEGRRLRFGALTLVAEDGAPACGEGVLAEGAARLTGAPWSPGALDGLARALREACQAEGWLDADVRVEPRLPSPGEGDEVSARLLLHSGPAVHLRSVVLLGNRTTRLPLLWREDGLTRGQPLGSDDIDQARRRLYALGVFRAVTTEVVGDGAGRDLLIRVEPRPAWVLDVGGGVNTDQGVRLFGALQRNDLWGLAHRLDLRAQVGLDWVPAIPGEQALTVAPEWRVAMTYTAPHFPLRVQTLRFDALLRERIQERTWSIARYGVGASLETRLASTTITVSARWELRRLLTVTPGALIDGEPWSLLPDPTAGAPTAWRPQEQLLLSVVHDRRDDQVAPTRGVLASARATWSPGIVAQPADPLPQAKFLSADGGVTTWLPVSGPIVRLTAEAGLAWAYGGTVLPLEDRFRLGGTGSLRGIPRDGVGPHNRIATPVSGALPSGAPLPDSAAWVPTGGDAWARGIFELSLPFPLLGLPSWEGYAVSVFADFGNVWLINPDARVDSGQAPWREQLRLPVRASVGLGPRVLTPIGPIQLDLAFNLGVLTSRGATADLLQQQYGEPPVRLHLTLGNLW